MPIFYVWSILFVQVMLTGYYISGRPPVARGKDFTYAGIYILTIIARGGVDVERELGMVNLSTPSDSG